MEPIPDSQSLNRFRLEGARALSARPSFERSSQQARGPAASADQICARRSEENRRRAIGIGEVACRLHRVQRDDACTCYAGRRMRDRRRLGNCPDNPDRRARRLNWAKCMIINNSRALILHAL